MILLIYVVKPCGSLQFFSYFKVNVGRIKRLAFVSLHACGQMELLSLKYVKKLLRYLERLTYYFPPERPPLTDDAQKVLHWAFDHKLKSGDSGEVPTSDLLLGIWSEVESPGHKILVSLGFNDEKAKELEASSSGPGFLDG